jgi:hypothetical protein
MKTKIFQSSLGSPHLEQVLVSLDLDHSAVCIVFNTDHPLVLTDDVKFKFYCSNVGAQFSTNCRCPRSVITEISTNWL